MSLITRCPACATMFKVVTDQLKVAQGWVRCGHCGEVFDASLHLVDQAGPDALACSHDAEPVPDQAAATQEMPQSLSPPATPGQLAENPMERLADTPSLTPESSGPVQGESRPDAAEADLVQPAPLPEAGEILVDTLPVGIPSANAPSEPKGLEDPAFTTDAYGFKQASLADADATGFGAEAPDVASSPAEQPAEQPEAAADVSFVRDARRKALWKTPLVRAGLGLLFVVLLAALALQWMVREKDVLAAQEPRLAPLLQALCRPLNCEIRPLRRIESVIIDSSSFSKTAPNAYRLTFVLKNTGDAALEIPAMEVTLTDSQDQALVRRVVMPAQFGATAVTLEARSELAGAVSLKVTSDGARDAAALTQAGPLPIAGYRILAFYP